MEKTDFVILPIPHIKKKSHIIIGAFMVMGDVIIQNGGFLAVHYTTYHGGQVKEFAKAISKFCRHIPHRVKKKKRK